MEIEKIIQIQFNDIPLDNLHLEVGAQAEDRFFAYFIVPVKDRRFPNLFDHYLKHRSHSSTRRYTEEEKKELTENPSRYNDWSGENPFADKSITEQISEGRFSHVSVVFSGCFFENNWYILENITYYENFSLQEVEISVKEITTPDALYDTPTFHIIPAFEIITDLSALHEMALQLDTKSPDIYQIPYKDWPTKIIPQYPKMRRFVGQPWMVAYIKQETKEKLNRQYENYINETIFFPFIKSLQFQHPEEFQVIHSLYGMHYPLIYPNNKDHVMAVIKTISGDETISRLYYFLYTPLNKKIYEWTHPLVRPVPGFHVFYIQEDLADLSDWGNDYDIADPSVTMDDPAFWNEYVFKKEKGKYLFLKEVTVKNNRKDIYPGY